MSPHAIIALAFRRVYHGIVADFHHLERGVVSGELAGELGVVGHHERILSQGGHVGVMPLPGNQRLALTLALDVARFQVVQDGLPRLHEAQRARRLRER